MVTDRSAKPFMWVRSPPTSPLDFVSLCANVYGQQQEKTMTEEQIERTAEREMNRLDRELMSNALTQEQYDIEVSLLDKWAQQQYKEMSKY